MKHMEQFYFNKFYEAIESGNDVMADEMERKYSRLTTGREMRTVVKVLLVLLGAVLGSPLIWWWLIGWR